MVFYVTYTYEASEMLLLPIAREIKKKFYAYPSWNV